MTFTPYLYFDGDCEAAMDFYTDVFGATEVQKIRYSEAPADQNLPSTDKIMYSHIMLGDHCLMGSDMPPGTPVQPQASVAINHSVPDTETGRALFDALGEDGTVTMPFAETFFSPGFGMLRDRFGTSWMIGVPPT